MLEAKPAEPVMGQTTARTVALGAAPAPACAPSAPPAATRAAPAGDSAGSVGGADALGPLLARAVARRAEQTGALLQRVPSNRNDPTLHPDGLYYDRQETTVQNGRTVPDRITAIMRNPGVGTVPSIAPPGWDWLESHVQRLKGNWVRFHIINRLLGGTGHNSLNLVPTSVAVNNAFSRGVETDAKLNVQAGEWTYIDVKLTYDGGWPAPIPKRIEAEQGTWNARTRKWEVLTTQHPVLVNFDIMQLNGGPIYLRGDNITAKQMELRGAPKSRAGAFANWLKTYTQGTDADDVFGANVDRAGFEEEWLTQIWLDEDEAAPGQYTPVVKKLTPRVTKQTATPKRKGKGGGAGTPKKLVGIAKKRNATSSVKSSSKSKRRKPGT